MKRLLLAILVVGTSASAGKTKPGDPAVDAPIEATEPELSTMTDSELFDAMVQAVFADPDYSGLKTGVQYGVHYAIIDRTQQPAAKVKPKPPAKGGGSQVQSLLGQALSRAGSGSVTVRFTYVYAGFDANGKAFSETVTIDAGIATGAAAQAQASMDEAMGKNHR